MNPEYRNKILFIDDAFLLEVHNLRRKVNPAAKHPEPIFQLNAPWDSRDDRFFWHEPRIGGDGPC